MGICNRTSKLYGVQCGKRVGVNVRVKSIITGCDLTEGKIYDVNFEYDSVYELKCDTGTYCRPKGFFEIVPETEID